MKKGRTRRITIISIIYDIGEVIKGVYYHIFRGVSYDTTGEEVCRRRLEKANKGKLVQVRKQKDLYELDVEEAIRLGVLRRINKDGQYIDEDGNVIDD